MSITLSDNCLLSVSDKRRRRNLHLLGVVILVAISPLVSVGQPLGHLTSMAQTATNSQLEETTNFAQTATNISEARLDINMDSMNDKHTLAIGDIVSFRILEDDDAPRTLIVTDSGDLEVPYIGRFKAENETCKKLAQEIKIALEKEYYYRATVIIAVNSLARSRGKVYLVGPVRVPGAQELPSDEILTVGKAILRAGGFTDFADKHHVKITRQRSGGKSGNETLIVDVGQIFDKGKTEKDVALKPSDLIYIPERMIRF